MEKRKDTNPELGTLNLITQTELMSNSTRYPVTEGVFKLQYALFLRGLK